MSDMSYTVLNVDNGQAAREAILERAGYRVLTAKTGAEALRVAQEESPALVLMPLNLPDINGLEVCRRLKAYPNTSSTMVLLLSDTRVTAMVGTAGFEAGADAYISEPAEPELLAWTKSLLRLYRSEADNRELLSAMTDHEQRLQRTNEGLRLLNEAAGQMLTSSDPRAMIEKLFVQVSQYLSADMFLNYMLEENAPEGTPPLRLEAAGGLTESAYEPLRRLWPGQAVCGTSAQERRIIYVPDVQRSDDSKSALVAALGVRAYVCYPLLVGDRVIGTLSFGSRQKNHFTNEELDFLRALSHQVASAKEWLRTAQSLRESEEEFRIAFEAAGIGRAQLDPRSGRFLRVNAKLCEILSCSPEQLIGRSFLDFIDPQDRGGNSEDLQPFFSGGAPAYAVEKRAIRSDGTVIWCSVTSVLMNDRYGNPLAAVTEVQDITERKKAEEALRESEQRFRTLADSSPVLIWVTNAEGGVDFVNHAYLEYFGVDEQDVKGGKWRYLVHPDDLEPYAEAYRVAVRDAEPFRAQARVRRADGEWRWIDSYGLPRFSSSGEFLGHVGSSPDVTDVKLAEAAVRDNQRRLRFALNAAKIGSCDIEVATGKAVTSTEHDRCFGFTERVSDWTTDKLVDLVYPDDRALVKRAIEESIARQKDWHFSCRVIWPDGTVHWIQSHGTVSRVVDGVPTHLSVIVQDITERKRADEALREHQQRLDLAQKTAKAGIWDWNIAENRATWSEAAWELFGMPVGPGGCCDAASAHNHDCEVNYELWRNCLHPEDRARAEAEVQSVLTQGTDYSAEFRVVTKDGRVLWHASRGRLIRDAAGQPQRLIGINIDITERKRMEDDLRRFSADMEKKVAERTAALEAANAAIVRELEERTRLEQQLWEAQKMESIGTLAAGIAHDFNNTLNVIKAYTSLLEEHRCGSEDISEAVSVIDEAVDTGASTVRQLLTLASKADVELESVDVNTLITHVERILRQTFPKTIEISVKRRPHLPAVVLDRNHITQALLNICVNARDAMPSGGQLVLRTGIIDADEIGGRRPEADARHYVFIEVSDSGQGMEESVQKRIFDPFFTTKQSGKGTGLGLSVVFGIVKKHGGFIQVESQPQHGTTFQIYLPVELVSGQVRSPAAPPMNRELQAESRGTILIVEDNEKILPLLSKRFEQWGFHVLSAGDGEAALRVYRQHEREINAVLLDIGLPKISGERVLFTLKQDNPQLAVIVASGYIDPGLKSDLLQAGVSAFVTKPYELHQLHAVIRAALERSTALER